MDPLTKEHRKETEKSQLPTRKAIKKALLQKGGRRCAHCYRKTVPVRLVRVWRKKESLKRDLYILLCHDCIIERQEKRKEEKKRFWRRKPSKRKISKTGFYNRIRKKVFERDDHRCLWCESQKNLGLGSLIPESRGGKLTFDNFVTACSHCRPSKGNMLPLDYLWKDIDVDEYLHEQFDHALRVQDPGKNITIRFFLFAEISNFLHRLTNNDKIPSRIRSKAE
ncbi:unnamed protein product, partial [marine sediment metagenome]